MKIKTLIPFTPVREKRPDRGEVENIESWTWDILHPKLWHLHAQPQPLLPQ